MSERMTDAAMADALMSMASTFHQQHDSELIDLLEQSAAALRARPQAVAEDTAMLDWLDKQREDMVQNNNGEPELYAHAWGVYGRCNTVREAICDEMLAASKAGGALL